MNYADLKIFIDIPVLQTDRLILRKITRLDLEDVFEYASDPEVSKYLLWYPHVDKKFTLQYLKILEREYRKMNFFDWGVTVSESGKMIGTCGFTAFDIINNSAEIGYVLNADYWGQGYAEEMIRKILDFGFNVLGLHRIEAKMMCQNTSSSKVAEKCGMRFEGTLRESVLAKGKYVDVKVFAITETNYKKLINSHINECK